MSYINQIPLTEAKEWLRLDDNNNDNIVKLMIEQAASFFESKTNRLIYQRSKDYLKDERIYDFPIADETDLIKHANYYVADKDVTKQVGYLDGELPSEIKTIILTMVESSFYANEDEDITNYPPIVMQGIESYKRFLI